MKKQCQNCSEWEGNKDKDPRAFQVVAQCGLDKRVRSRQGMKWSDHSCDEWQRR